VLKKKRKGGRGAVFAFRDHRKMWDLDTPAENAGYSTSVFITLQTKRGGCEAGIIPVGEKSSKTILFGSRNAWLTLR
jgi:hypothetical protein